MPKAAAACKLVVTPTKCRATSWPPCARNHSRATLALASVSWVVKVLLTTTNSVSSGLKRRSTGAMSWPSTLLTKCIVMPGCAKASSAGTTICGPRSLPPMPMFTTCRMPLDAVSRKPSAKASIRSSTPCTSSLNSPWPRGARSAVCSTARPSVALIAAPANIASRLASNPHSRARSSSNLRVSRSQRFLDRSAKSSGACSVKASKRPASRAKASRKSRSRPWAW